MLGIEHRASCFLTSILSVELHSHPLSKLLINGWMNSIIVQHSSWDGVNRPWLIPDYELVTQKSKGATRVQLGKLVSLLYHQNPPHNGGRWNSGAHGTIGSWSGQSSLSSVLTAYISWGQRDLLNLVSFGDLLKHLNFLNFNEFAFKMEYSSPPPPRTYCFLTVSFQDAMFYLWGNYYTTSIWLFTLLNLKTAISKMCLVVWGWLGAEGVGGRGWWHPGPRKC